MVYDLYTHGSVYPSVVPHRAGSTPALGTMKIKGLLEIVGLRRKPFFLVSAHPVPT